MAGEVGVKRWQIRGLTSKRVRAFDPEKVTARGLPETDPASVGLGPDDVESIWSAVVDFYKTGFHPALGLCIRRRGEVILDRTIGHARGNSPDDLEGTPLVPATPKTLFNFFSGSKAVTAMLVHLLVQREQLHVDEPVATFIPEFARNRKHRITIRDLLTHRGGIPDVPPEAANLDLLQDPQRILELIYELEPTYKPGTVPAYHAITSGFVFEELIKRVSGLGIRELLHQEISEPLGMSHFNYGVPAERLDEVAVDACTGPKLLWPLKDIFEKALGVPFEEVIDISNDPRFRTGVVPSANLIATADASSSSSSTVAPMRAGRSFLSPRFVERSSHRHRARSTERSSCPCPIRWASCSGPTRSASTGSGAVRSPRAKQRSRLGRSRT